MGLKNFLIFGMIGLMIIFLPFVSSDIISVDAGGGKDVVVNSGNFIQDFFTSTSTTTCSATTCAVLGYTCGTASDGCGGTLDCGTCSAGYTCSSGTCVVTPTGDTGGGGGGGGGGGASVSTRPSNVLTQLKAVPESFNLPAVAGVSSSNKISLTNTGATSLEISISVLNLQGIVEFPENNLILAPGETKILTFETFAPNEPGIFAGKIVFSSGIKKLEVPFALNVESKLSLFDIFIDVSDEYKTLDIGEKLVGQITLIQAGLQEQTDVTLNYVVKDFEGNTYLTKSETIMVYKQKSYQYEFQTQDLPPGDYLIGAEVIYSGGVATASHQFKILSPEEKRFNYILVGELILAILVLVVLIKLVKRYKKK